LGGENDAPSIEQKFSESWDMIERVYTDLFTGPHWQWLKSILTLVAELRARGYDKRFRAGTQLTSFILSRSQEDGLRREQARLVIDLHPGGGMTITYLEPPSPAVEVNLERVELTPELEQLLLRLLTHPID
jgi:hypothetical protein